MRLCMRLSRLVGSRRSLRDCAGLFISHTSSYDMKQNMGKRWKTDWVGRYMCFRTIEDPSAGLRKQMKRCLGVRNLRGPSDEPVLTLALSIPIIEYE